ncbi:MAG: DEAD/DEAH box helicase [Christensenellaceae bacterium]|jgi:SNF2 family DNA or RNA helicase|nr:DEAD/DEAH box helicase [Christensenellaceae bacterium]
MGVLHIDSTRKNDKLIVNGDIGLVLSCRRAIRFLKDNTTYVQTGESIVVDIEGNVNKTMERLKTAANYANCTIEISDFVGEDVARYVSEEAKFADFSQMALDIRENRCNMSDFSAFRDALVANLSNRTLYGLQMLSAYHLAFAQNACNFSVPGAGKSSIVYGAYAYLKNLPKNDRRKVDRLLIIGPLNSFGPWESEYEECFGEKAKSKRLTGGLSIDAKKQYFYNAEPAELTLVSYPSIISLVHELTYFLKKQKVMVVLDEAHKIKNTNGGIVAQSIMNISEFCSARAVLTGTPAPNGYEDLYNLFKFIWPNKQIIRFHIGQLKDMSRAVNDIRVDFLLQAISPFFMRIKKSDLGIPPATNHPPEIVPMKPSQRRIYDYIESRYIHEMGQMVDHGFHSDLVKARLIRLMQAATNPALLKQPLSEFVESEKLDLSVIKDETIMIEEILRYSDNEIPAKFEAVRDKVREIIACSGKVIVWSCYIKNIVSLQTYLQTQGITSKILYGATPIAGDALVEDDDEYSLTREAIIKEFHNMDCPYSVIIANPFAVAESISLHKACHNAIYLERTFNAAHFIQSKDRIHRYGLKPGVETNYYYFLSEDSVDYTVHERLNQKERRLLEIIENMPIPLFDNNFDDSGDDDIKAVLRDYVQRTRTDQHHR